MSDIEKAISALIVDLWMMGGFILGSFEHWLTALLFIAIGWAHSKERTKP